MKIPPIAKAVTLPKSTHSIFAAFTDKSPVKPINDFAAIINNEVPTAIFIGSLLNITKAGMIKKPPPAPTKPVKTPTTAPSKIIKG